MMAPIIFATGNSEKRAVAEHACSTAGISLECISIDIDEIQGEDPRLIVEDKAKRAFEAYGKPIVVSDDSWSIPALNGFPGPYMKSMNHWFTPEDFLRLMQGIANRTVLLHQHLAYYDGATLQLFTQDIPGTVSQTVRGTAGKAPWMKVVQLEIDGGKTLAEAFENPEEALHKRYQEKHDAWHDLLNWYKEKYA